MQIKKLKIGFIGAGDDLNQIKQIEKLLAQHTINGDNEKNCDVDIIVNTCRTKGAGRRYLQNNFNYHKGWLVKNIFVEKIHPSSASLEAMRDSRILDELKTWITGLEKL